MKNQLHLTGAGNIYPYCCDFDLCNSDMCTAMNLPAGNSKCVTTITNKQEQAVLLQQGVIKNEVENTKPQQVRKHYDFSFLIFFSKGVALFFFCSFFVEPVISGKILRKKIQLQGIPNGLVLTGLIKITFFTS